MTRAELEKAGFTKEQIDGIMALHGKSIEAVKAQITEKEAEIAKRDAQLAEAAKAIDGFKKLDVEAIKKSADEWKTKFEKEAADRAAFVKQTEKTNTAKEILAGLKPKSKLVEKAALADLMTALDDPKFKADKWGKEYLEANKDDFGDVKKAGGLEHGQPPASGSDDAVRKAMGLKPAPAAK